MAAPRATLLVISTRLVEEKLGKKDMYLAITIDGIFVRTVEARGIGVNWGFRYEFSWQSQQGITFRMMKRALIGTDKVEGNGSVVLSNLLQAQVQGGTVPLTRKSRVIGNLTYEVRITGYGEMLMPGGRGGSMQFPVYAAPQPIPMPIALYVPTNPQEVFNRTLGIADIHVLDMIYRTPDGQVEVRNCRIIPSNHPAIVKISHCATSDRFNTVQKEGLIMCRMTHRSVCGFYESLLDNRNGTYDHWLVMEKVDGVSLGVEIERRAKARRPWMEEELKRHMGDMLDAFAYMQSQTVCHSDIKPDNLILASANVIKIIDFGLSLVGIPDINLRQATFKIGGTANFFSPLQMEAFKAHQTGRNPHNLVQHNPYKSDVYALGLVFLSMSKLKYIEGLSEGPMLEERLAGEIREIRLGSWLQDLLSYMLIVEEARRPDFKTLKKLGLVEPEQHFTK